MPEGTEDRWAEIEQVLPGWRALAEGVAAELTAWRRAHPRATLAEIEAVVEEVGQRLRARALEDVVRASAAADLAVRPADERPARPSCGGRLKGRGMRRARAHVDPLVALRTVAGGGPVPPPVVLGDPSPVAVVAPARAAPTPGVARPRTIVDGRPTRWHPWRRYPLRLGHRHTPPAATG